MYLYLHRKLYVLFIICWRSLLVLFLKKPEKFLLMKTSGGIELAPTFPFLQSGLFIVRKKLSVGLIYLLVLVSQDHFRSNELFYGLALRFQLRIKN
jgi:hypothetical protein